MRFFNTLHKQIEEFAPEDGVVRMYSCGPTVYNYAHIGNLRSFIVADLLYRTLKYNYEGKKQVKWVMNITDIDDKTIKGAIEKYGNSATVNDLYDFTETYLQAFVSDLKEANVSIDEIQLIRVTDKMKEIAQFIKGLLDKGYAYKTDDGSVYFSIEKYQADFGDYGELVGEKFIEGKKVGARVKVDEYDKEALSDFALWKAHDENDAQIFWEYPEQGLVKGRPGWHIECSVINQVAFAGKTTDIHTGGIDLVFPHHTNEIAQSQALLGKNNFVKSWLHSEHLLVDGKKMSKSLGNFYTLKDIKEKGFSGLDFRYLMFSITYRGQQNFTWESLQSSQNALARLQNFCSSNTEGKEGNIDCENRFLESLTNDVNLPKALGITWEMINSKDIMGNVKKKSLLKFDEVLGLNLALASHIETPDEVKKLVNERQEARKNKDFAKSDELRTKIEDLGFEVLDTAAGQKVKKK